MTTGSTKPDAMPVFACAFVIARPPVARLRTLNGASRASLKTMAAHGVPLAPRLLERRRIEAREIINGLQQAPAFRAIIEDSGNVVARAARPINAGPGVIRETRRGRC